MEARQRSADELVNILLAEPNRLDAIKANPAPELKRLSDEAKERVAIYTQDKTLYRIAVSVLGLLALTAAFGSVFLTLSSKTTPEVLVAIGSAAVGALVGLFAPSPSSSS